MTSYALITPAGPVELVSDFTDNDGNTYPSNWLDLSTPEERAARQITQIVDAPAVPAHKFVASRTIEIVDDQPTWVETYMDEDIVQAGATLSTAIDTLRNDKIAGGFDVTLSGAAYRVQSAPSDRENIIALGSIALMKSTTATPGDLKWVDGVNDFHFIMADNSQVPLDVAAMVSLYQTGLQFKNLLTFYARGLKDQVNAAVAAADWTTLDALASGYATGWPS